MAGARLRHMLAALGAAALLALVPLLNASSYLLGVLTVGLIYALWAASWDFMSGLTGRENFGHGLFIGAGAYTAGFLNTLMGVNPWWSLPAGVLVAVGFSLVMGFPTLRLRGPYFALAMLSAAAIMQRLALIFWEVTGGEEGISGITPLILAPRPFYYFVLATVIFSCSVLIYLAHSPRGLILRAIRGDEASCQAAGINVTFYKVGALAVSAAFAGLGGALYAHYQQQISPSLFAVATSITVIIMVYVGGIGTIYGSIGGAIGLTLLTEMLRGFGEYRLWVYTLILIFILFFAPRGLIAPLYQRLVGVRR